MIYNSQENPLLIDWPQDTELNNTQVYNRVTTNLLNHKGKIIFIVQKYETYTLDQGFVPLGDYKIVDYVHAHLTKIG
ncbi:MAG: hypothetical protein ACLQG5_02965 [Methanobacterium sp.]